MKFWKWYIREIVDHIRMVIKFLTDPFSGGISLVILSVFLSVGFTELSVWSLFGLFGIPVGVTLAAYGHWKESVA